MVATKISELNSLPGGSITDDDVFVLVDESESETKRTNGSDLKTYFGALYLALTGGTMTGELVVKETKDTQYSLTGTAINPANGNIQYKTLMANTTFTESLENGQTVALYIDDGTAYAITWPTITWMTSDGLEPTLATTGYNVIVIQKMNGTLYGYDVKVGS